jgi:predicted O-linked N-acetylglucosamine transferase (SPINDLY family)
MTRSIPEIIIKIANQIGKNGHTNQKQLILEAIEQSTLNTEYLFELSILCLKKNKLEDAELLLDCLSLKENNSKIFYNLGLVRSLNGRHNEAVEAYDYVLKLNPNDVETLINKSSAYNELKKYDHSLRIADEAIKIKPLIPEAWVNKGTALSNLNLFEESIKAYKEACRLNPLCLDAWLNQSLPLNSLGRYDDALIACDETIKLQTNSDKAYANRAVTLYELKRYGEAINDFDKAIALNSNFAEYYFGKGIALHHNYAYSEALTEFNKAISIQPNYADAHYHKGLTLYEMKQYKQALFQISNAIRVNSHKSEYWYSKGVVFKELCQPNEASQCFTHAFHLNSKDRLAQWANAFTFIPHILRGDEDSVFLRDQFSQELRKLNESITDQELDGLFKLVGSHQPFYLAYQNFNNKVLLSEYGLICDRFMRHWQFENKVFPLANSKLNKIKIGIVSSHIYDHSVWNAVTKGFVLNFDLNKFEVYIFYLGEVFDEETKLAKSIATSFLNEKMPLHSWAKLICEKNMDVLFYPEVGMHKLTTQLAAIRICGMKIVVWGQPETTGLPSIDYFLSGELYEADVDDTYTEHLIKLPNLASYFYKVPATSLPHLSKVTSLGDEIPLLVCPGTPYKYDPQNDWIFIEIVKRLGKCKLVFFDYNEDLTLIFKMRLTKKFNSANLSIDDFIVFSPWLASNDFYDLMKKSTVFLDTIGFSGFNTAIQAIECELPIVTRWGGFMRGNLASGLLKRIGLSQLIANSDYEYIELVVKLINDKKYHQDVVGKMAVMKNLLYEDYSVVRAFEDFLTDQLRTS